MDVVGVMAAYLPVVYVCVLYSASLDCAVHTHTHTMNLNFLGWLTEIDEMK